MNVILMSDQKSEHLIDKMYAAAKTCYSNNTPEELYQDDSVSQEAKLKLIKQVLGSGHQSIAEHVQFTWGIEGISRSCSHQFVRMRIATFSQQSQRYTKLDQNDNDWYVIPPAIAKTYDTAEDYDLAREFVDLMDMLQRYYNKCVEAGIKGEDARFVLPNAAKTNITFSCNLRELIHICNLRLCTRAQWEIRQMIQRLVEVTVQEHPFLKEYLVPQCEALGFCPEHQCCGRKPKRENI